MGIYVILKISSREYSDKIEDYGIGVLNLGVVPVMEPLNTKCYVTNQNVKCSPELKSVKAKGIYIKSS